MTTHSSIRAWRILWTEERGGLQSMESQRVRHNRVTNTTTMTIELLVLGIMLCSRSPELIYLRQLNLCTLWSLPFPHSSAFGSLHSIPCFYECDYFFYFTFCHPTWLVWPHFPDQKSYAGPWQWKCRVLTTWTPREFPVILDSTHKWDYLVSILLWLVYST